MTPDKTISLDDLYNRPLVYGVRRNNAYIYIGMSTKGYSRVYSSNHHIINKKWEPGDVVDIWFTSDPHRLEQQLIKAFYPKYNKVIDTIRERKCKECGSKYEVINFQKISFKCPRCLEKPKPAKVKRIRIENKPTNFDRLRELLKQ